jgi:hypothetical protein
MGYGWLKVGQTAGAPDGAPFAVSEGAVSEGKDGEQGKVKTPRQRKVSHAQGKVNGPR